MAMQLRCGDVSARSRPYVPVRKAFAAVISELVALDEEFEVLRRSLTGEAVAVDHRELMTPAIVHELETQMRREIRRANRLQLCRVQRLISRLKESSFYEVPSAWLDPHMTLKELRDLQVALYVLVWQLQDLRRREMPRQLHEEPHTLPLDELCLRLPQERLDQFRRHRYSRADQQADGDRCPICQRERSLGDLVVALDCGHRFHEECMYQMFAFSRTCGVCRHDYGGDNVVAASFTTS